MTVKCQKKLGESKKETNFPREKIGEHRWGERHFIESQIPKGWMDLDVHILGGGK